uniref:Uncharacterized protein n=1 Tax=Knipowitschia caucasica TaxID=637954 RepID=A0AAV2LNY5_KNICA
MRTASASSASAAQENPQHQPSKGASGSVLKTLFQQLPPCSALISWDTGRHPLLQTQSCSSTGFVCARLGPLWLLVACTRDPWSAASLRGPDPQRGAECRQSAAVPASSASVCGVPMNIHAPRKLCGWNSRGTLSFIQAGGRSVGLLALQNQEEWKTLWFLLKTSAVHLQSSSGEEPYVVYQERLTIEYARREKSLPVYRSQSQAKFMSVFHVIRDFEWAESLSLNITGHSDNQNSSKGSLVKVIPVQFEIKMTLLVEEDSVTYLNFTTEDPAPKRVVTKYTNTTKCRESYNESSPSENNIAYCTPERECMYIVCDPFLLTNASVEFELSGQVQFKDLSRDNVPFLKRYTGDNNVIEFKSFLFVTYDKQKYSLDFYNRKLGCFKRKLHAMV